jgi:SprB repeat
MRQLFLTIISVVLFVGTNAQTNSKKDKVHHDDNSSSENIWTVTTTDEKGCTNNTSIALSTPVITLTATNGCNGENNGAIFSSVSTPCGGTFGYLWNTGATTPNISGLSPGTYSVTVTSLNGCGSSTASINIINPPAINVPLSPNQILCNGNNNGSITANPTGGTLPYTYLWSNGGTMQSISGLAPGTYSVIVTDANGCTKSNSSTITQPTAIELNTSFTNVSCNGGNNGTATVTATGGTGSYGYLWSNGGTTATINNLVVGTYNVTVTDANGCTKNTSVTITQPTALVISTSSTNVSCNGGNNGTATVFGTGGVGPYTHLWSTGATTQTISGLTAGTYSVTVTNANGCTKNTSVTITQPTALVISTSSTNVSCNGGNNGTATVFGAGGVGPYTHLWSTGATTQTISGLTAGTYSVTVTDANGCTKNTSATINQPNLVVLNTTSTNVSCNGGNNGTATVSATGGVTPYQYLWSNGATTSSINNLIAGTYNVTVTDANGCIKTTSVVITQPALIVLNTSFTNVSCNGGNNGAATVTPTGGVTPYQYLWSNGGTTSTINNLVVGTYNVTVTDANGCTKNTSVTITQPTALVISTSSTNVSCNGGNNGTATVFGTGGVGPYTHLWSTGATTQTISGLTAGTYSVTVTDANGCTKNTSVTITQPTLVVLNTSSANVICNGGNNGTATVAATGGVTPYQYLWSNGATTPTINNLVAGTYNVTVTDANGCVKTASVTITQPTLVVLNTSFTNVSCNGGNNGAATVTPTGGVTPYQYLWSNGATTSSITNLIAGTYNVTVTDANGCIKTASVTITQPTTLVISTSSTNVSCNGGNNGTATVFGTGGVGPYTHLWSNGATTQSISNLTAGTYSVTVTDANGCTKTTSVTINQPTLVVLNTSSTNISCNGGNNGTATVAATGGVTPYQYLWSNGATTSSINNLVAGTYNVTVTDANGCIKNASVTLNNPALVTVNLGADKTLCLNQTHIVNGTTNINQVGVIYEWTSSNGFTASTPIVTLSATGNYYLKATTSLGCIARDTISITALNNPISSDFVVASQVFKNKKITIVNIANPKPDSIAWIIPNNPLLTIQSNTQSLTEILVSDTGTFFISMRSRLGLCESITTKKIVVLEPQPFDTTLRVQDPLIRAFTVAPSPNNGQFTVKISLKEISNIRLRLLNAITNAVVNDRASSGLKEYTIPYNLSVPSGVYVLLLETPKATRVYKIIIN